MKRNQSHDNSFVCRKCGTSPDEGTSQLIRFFTKTNAAMAR